MTAMIMGMGTLRITEAELARDVHAVLSKVQEGMEVNRRAGPPPRGNDQVAQAFGAADFRMHRFRHGQRLQGDTGRRFRQRRRRRD